MKYHGSWSYHPYRPLFFDSGEIYICRIAPAKSSITFDVSEKPEKEYSVFLRKRGEGEFAVICKMAGTRCILSGLCDGGDYEFYVSEGEKKSRVRLARTGESFGSVVNYLHPEDGAYSFSGKYLCSPSLLRHPDGYLLASMDVFAPNYPQDLTLIFRSDDDGRSWNYVCELFPCFWGKMFLHGGELYMFGVSTEYGDMLIGKSTDGGRTWSEPTVLFRGGGGKNGEAGIHRNPMPVVSYGGRIWNTVEWGSWGRDYHAPMVISADENADLLSAESWTFSSPVKYDESWQGLPAGKSAGNIEGSLVVFPDGKLYNVMRYDMGRLTQRYGKVIVYRVDTECPAAPLEYAKAMDFPANYSKFEIIFDEKSGCYLSLATRIIDEAHAFARDLLSLMYSRDMIKWEVACDVYDKLDLDPAHIGFQYVDFLIEGDDILFLCRTAWNGAHSFHDSNFSVFDRIKNFRNLLK